jgi:hypothetical protein
MNPLASDTASAPEQPPAPPPPASGSDLRSEDAAAAIGRLEGLVREIRGALDASAREREHREFSIARLLAAIAQGLAIGLLLWAALDWLMPGERGEGAPVVKLLFAIVLQLMALTAFYVSRPNR